jgi:hypothetical protein
MGDDVMWKITMDYTETPAKRVNITSYGYDGRQLSHAFQMFDDDGNLDYRGLSDDCMSERAFEPLDDYGMPNAGCTSIHYWDPEKEQWAIL